MAKDLSELKVQFIKGVGPRKAELLAKLGIRSVWDAMLYSPMRYEDRRSIRNIRDTRAGVHDTVSGSIITSELKNIKKGFKIFELTVSDGTGIIKGKWFNQPYLKKVFKTGSTVVLSGTVKYGWRGAGLEMENPDYEFIGDADDHLVHMGRIVPVYRATENLSPKQIRTILFNVIRVHGADVTDPMPEELLKKNGFPGLAESIANTHFPGPEADLEALNSWRTEHQQRLSFEELFMLELGLAVLKRGKLRERGIAFKPDGKLLEKLRDSLPFSLTGAQERVFKDIQSDMESPWPMHRLIQGDVGSGKTVVALMAMLGAVESGYQAALMAPTEILARQHYLNISKMVEGLGLSVTLLTGGEKNRSLDEITSGEVNIVVGTHALIQEAVDFKGLGLAVIDEQHRFGVMQRSLLRKKAGNPDVLVMTATPIPRTLAMTLYGDLDCSVIDELPPGRAPVKTMLFTPDEKSEIYRLIAGEVEAGGRVYAVYPLIEESEKTALRSAIVGEEALKKVFPKMSIALIHGKIKPADREEVMREFKKGNIDILVSTTVIEVGVDVPEASLMLIVHAERFGLSQLHQLRGRVGRGSRRSGCLLLAYGPLSEEARRRLDVMTRTSDGFKIAEEDLDIRGPGELMGTRQSGIPGLRVANLVRDARLLEPARREAFSLIDKDPELQGAPALRAALEGFWQGRIELFRTA
jgi:ATP-dependent DNA helicase RecG